jgi:hypothetical protein
MDRLDEIAAVAEPLLRRVDDMVTDQGAPAGHHLWAALRRVRLLPADAVRAVLRLRPAALDPVGPQLRRRSADHAELAASLPDPGGWTGDAAEAYDLARRRMAGHLGPGPESLAERLDTSADLGDALAQWMRRTRTEVAGALADVLVSAEAVVLSGAPPAGAGASPVSAAEVLAAADIAARVLRVVADAYDVVEDLLSGSVELLRASPPPSGRHVTDPFPG